MPRERHISTAILGIVLSHELTRIKYVENLYCFKKALLAKLSVYDYIPNT